jgi:hypothetical protein
MLAQFIWWLFQIVTVDAPATSGLRVIRWLCYCYYGKSIRAYDDEIANQEKNPKAEISRGAWGKKKMDENIAKKSLCFKAIKRAKDIKVATLELNKNIDKAAGDDGKPASPDAIRELERIVKMLEVENVGIEYDNAICACFRKVGEIHKFPCVCSLLFSLHTTTLVGIMLSSLT